jgi:hypothetical protein
MRRLASGAVLLWLCLLGADGRAQDKRFDLPVRKSPFTRMGIPKFRISISNLLVARYNPLGLENRFQIGPQIRLKSTSSAILKDNYVFAGAAIRINPAFLKIGPMIEVQPLSILNIRFAAELMQWFGTFDFTHSAPSPLDNYSDSTIALLGDQNRHYRATGAHIYIEPTLQLKVGPIAVRNRFSAEYWNMNTRAGDTVFYEPTLDTMVPANGWVISNDLDVLYLSPVKLVVGVRYSMVQPFYSGGAYRPGEVNPGDDPAGGLNQHHRFGPLLAYTFFDRGYVRFNKPSLILIANWYLNHRWRTGADVNQGIPYLVLAFAFQSSLIP